MTEKQVRAILVTGGCGYLGSQIVEDLGSDPRFRGTTIRILDNLQSGRLQTLLDLTPSGRLEFVEGDILDPSVLGPAMSGVDTVLHLAAIERTPFGFENPSWLEQVNHWGTSHLVNECLAATVDKLIFASTAAVYGPGGPFLESSPCRPLGSYAESKKHAEDAVLAAADRGLRPLVLRLGTLFGWAPAMRFDALVNRFAYLAGVGRSLTVYGDGKQRRASIHVRDASDVVRSLIASGSNGRTVLNVAAGNPSVLEVTECIKSLKPETRIHFTEQHILTRLSLEVECGPLQSLGWKPKYDLTRGLAELFDRFAYLRTPVYVPGASSEYSI